MATMIAAARLAGTIRSMAQAAIDRRRMLQEARDKAKALIATLAARSSDLERGGGTLDAAELETGRKWLASAIQSATHAMQEFERAMDQE